MAAIPRNLSERNYSDMSGTSLDEFVIHYKQQLEDLASQRRFDAYQQQFAASAYASAACSPLEIRGREFTPFAPFRARYSALRTFTSGQICVLFLLLIGVGTGIFLYKLPFVMIILALITLFYLTDTLFTCFLSLRGLRASTGEQISDALIQKLADANWPHYTILCPLYREAGVAAQLVQALQRLDYPVEKLQILLLTHDDDVETQQILQRLNLPPYFYNLIIPKGGPRTKPRACNYGLLYATGEYVVIYDAEDIPESLQLKKAVLTFLNHGPDVACVQAKLSIYNASQNLMSRWFASDFLLWFDLRLPGLQSLGLPLPLSGTSNHLRLSVLREVGAWDAFNVAEDCDLGLRLARYKYRTIIVDSFTYEEANSRLRSWLYQRSRWIKGYLQTYFVNMRRPWQYLQPQLWPQFLSLQFNVGAKTAIMLVNPIMWLLFWIYILFHTQVEVMYHVLFPVPVLYVGTLSLILGNFLSIYSSMLCCLRRQRYDMIKWALIAPLYWLFMSVAAYIALFELIFTPHYWHKTSHGLHLQSTEKVAGDISVLRTAPLDEHFNKPQDIITDMQKTKLCLSDTIVLQEASAAGANSIPPESHISAIFKQIDYDSRQRSSLVRTTRLVTQVPLSHDLWFWGVFFLAITAGLFALNYFFSRSQTLAYIDASSHLLIARRVIDNLTPGLAQLGGVWLPLPHLVMLPFIWNDTLWHSGLAGSLISFLCYILSSLYVYLGAWRLTNNRAASFIGALLFVLNSNILYLQSTPLSEPLLIATMTMACYHFLAWAQDDDALHLVMAAVGAFLSTLSRYEGWFLFVAMFVGIVLVCLMRRESRVQIEGKLLVFSVLGGAGIALWLLWNAVIFGDPLYFQRGPFSSQTDQVSLIQEHRLQTYHNLWQSLSTFSLTAFSNIGLWTTILACGGLVLLLLRRRFCPEHLACIIFVAPFIFYVIALFFGQAVIFIGASGLFNVRYGSSLVAPASIFASVFLSKLLLLASSTGSGSFIQRRISNRLRLLQRLIISTFVLTMIVGQTVFTFPDNIITLQSGLYGGDCSPSSNITSYLARHYSGGKILLDFHSSRVTGINFVNIPFKAVIYEGSGQFWQQALHNPASMAEWVITNPYDLSDMVTRKVNVTSSAFLTHFVALAQEPNGTILFHNKNQDSLPASTEIAPLFNTNTRCYRDDLQTSRSWTGVRRPEFQTGVAYPHEGTGSYGPSDTGWLSELQNLQKQTAARWISIPLSFSQDSVTSTQVRSDQLTPSPSAFANGIRAAHAQGYKVSIEPLLFAAPFDKPAHHWSGSIHFSTLQETGRWFDSYWETLKPYIEMAEHERAEQLAIGTEEDTLSTRAPVQMWNTLIERVRSVFSGKITYNMNWTSVAKRPPAWLRNPQLYAIGVSSYFPLLKQPRRLNASELQALWKEKARVQLDKLAQNLGKPLILSEVGFSNRSNAAYATWDATVRGRADPQEQALACDAVLYNVHDDPHIIGVFFWGWDNVSGFGLRNMPAAATIHAWYLDMLS